MKLINLVERHNRPTQWWVSLDDFQELLDDLNLSPEDKKKICYQDKVIRVLGIEIRMFDFVKFGFKTVLTNESLWDKVTDFKGWKNPIPVESSHTAEVYHTSGPYDPRNSPTPFTDKLREALGKKYDKEK